MRVLNIESVDGREDVKATIKAAFERMSQAPPTHVVVLVHLSKVDEYRMVLRDLARSCLSAPPGSALHGLVMTFGGVGLKSGGSVLVTSDREQARGRYIIQVHHIDGARTEP